MSHVFSITHKSTALPHAGVDVCRNIPSECCKHVDSSFTGFGSVDVDSGGRFRQVGVPQCMQQPWSFDQVSASPSSLTNSRGGAPTASMTGPTRARPAGRRSVKPLGDGDGLLPKLDLQQQGRPCQWYVTL